MSRIHRDDRPALVALALILAALVFVALFESGARRFDDQPVHYQSGYGGAAQIQEHAEGDIANTDTGVDGFDFWRDPFAQYAMALFALIAAGTGVLGVFWLKQTLDATRDTADAAKGAIDLARQQFMTSFKPWLEITAIGPFLFDPEMIKDFREGEVIRSWGVTGLKFATLARCRRPSKSSRYGSGIKVALCTLTRSSPQTLPRSRLSRS